ncbi:MAG: hypothetical protein U0235_23065 [Polyangiaceae bacterium]
MNVAWLAPLALLGLGACSFIVEFHDKDDDGSTDGGAFEAGSIRPDGATVQSDGGLDGSFPVDDGATPDVEVPFTCAGKLDGTATPRGNDRFHCCGGVETDIGTNDNCGGCNIKCNAGAGHSCALRAGHFLCAGCANDGGGGGGACWTGCCTQPLGSSDGLCTPTQILACGTPIPACDDGICKGTAGAASGCDLTDGLPGFPYCHY